MKNLLNKVLVNKNGERFEITKAMKNNVIFEAANVENGNKVAISSTEITGGYYKFEDETVKFVDAHEVEMKRKKYK